MLTNGCTYGKAHSCGNHGPRSEVVAYQRKGPVCRVTTYQGGTMRKHGSYRAEHKDRMLAHLDTIAAVKVRPAGLLIRKARRG